MADISTILEGVMSKTVSDGKQIKVWMPAHLYTALQQEAKAAAVTMADLVRLAVAQRCGRLQRAKAREQTSEMLAESKATYPIYYTPNED